jgi:hypothetical protein
MGLPNRDLIDRAEEYCRRRGLELVSDQVFGFGVHGTVFPCRHHYEIVGRNAVKVHERPESYRRERDVYLRLRDLHVEFIQGHAVPQLVDYDDELLAIEMSVVARPFVLDFGGASLDHPPDYEAETLEQWRIEKEVHFEHNWPIAALILAELRRYGIYVSDVNPGNIGFVETEEPE